MATTFRSILKRLEAGRARLVLRSERGRPMLNAVAALAQRSLGIADVWVRIPDTYHATHLTTATLMAAGTTKRLAQRLASHSVSIPMVPVWIAPALPAATAAKRTRRTRTTATRG